MFTPLQFSHSFIQGELIGLFGWEGGCAFRGKSFLEPLVAVVGVVGVVAVAGVVAVVAVVGVVAVVSGTLKPCLYVYV